MNSLGNGEIVSVENWLMQYAAGYSNLRASERSAISHFALLWSFFEAKVMSRRASVPSIVAKVDLWDDSGVLKGASFEESLAYFRERYWKDGALTSLFEGLNFHNSDRKPLVESVLSGENQKARDIVLVLLLIVFRLRNNLFHGEKWLYGIHGQEQNFNNANRVLMKVLEL